MPSNILGVPVFALLIWLHAPLWKYFAGLIRSLAEDLHRRIIIAALAMDQVRGRLSLENAMDRLRFSRA